MIKNYFLVSFGAALGGALRYFTSTVIYKFLPPVFPYGTLTVNAAGSFIIGLTIFYFDINGMISSDFKLFMTVGFCGGLTTFSTFSLETINLIRDSQYFLAILNITANLLLTFIAVFAALYLSKILKG